MRIAELSRRTGVAVPTIKYYVREGLVPHGERTSRNQARYDEHHERRIRLVRALLDVGGLSIAETREILGHVDSFDGDIDSVLGRTLDAVVRSTKRPADESWHAAAEQTEELIRRRGWRVANQSVQYALIEVIAALHDLHEDDLLEVLEVYADAAEAVAAADLEAIGRRRDLDSILDGAVVGTVLGASLLLALRRVAHVDASARMFP